MRAAVLCALRAGARTGVLLLAIGAFLPASGNAQTLDLQDRAHALTQYKIDHWNSEQGLPLNTVQSLLHTSDGYLWVGTGGGLARFDGIRFTTFSPPHVPEIASRSIFGLFEDTDGNVWIGHSEGAAIYRDGRFRVAFGVEITEGRRVWGFAQAPDGAVWAATENGLVRWAEGETRVYREPEGLPTRRLRSVAFDTAGTLWIGTTGAGLVSFDGRRFVVLTPENGFPHLAVRFVLADPSGGIWAATAGGGLARLLGGRVTTYTSRDGLPTNQLTALSLDSNGTLWIGTWGEGLCRFRDGQFSSVSAEEGLAGGQLWSVHADREGSVWAGTWVDGLNRLRTRDFVVFGTPEGLSHDNVRSVIHARNGVTWVTTAGGGVNRIERGVVTTIRAEDGLPSEEASSILEDRDGSIWIGTYTAGVARLQRGRVESYGSSRGLSSLDVRALFQDRAGTIWAGTTSGLARFDGRNFQPVREKGAPSETVSTILEDRSGTLWFGTGEGLVRYRNGAFETLTTADGLVSNWIMDLYEDSKGSLWISTNGHGLNRLRNGQLSAVRPEQGLWDGMGQVLLADREGDLWLTCNRGFYRVSLADLDAVADGRAPRVTSVGYGAGHGLRSRSFAGGHQPAGAIDAAGRIWLPSFSGLVIVDPATLPQSAAPPVVRVEEVTVDGTEVSRTAAIVLPPGAVPLSIHYTAATLRDAERVRFRYRMGGDRANWVDAGQRREVYFPALSPGEYEFQLAASLDGVRWREAPPLSIIVKPHFFQTGWFVAVVSVMALAAAVAVMRLRTRQLRRQRAEMERLVGEKTEALRLANEHLARISFVDSLTGLANRRRFDEALEQEWQRARRFQTSLALIMLDVDLFKEYNDALGHPEGDRCLAAVADVLVRAGRRAGDLVARYGGEEFVVLIPGAGPEDAVAFAEKLRAACEERAIPHPVSSVAPVVTISLGVAACVPADDTSTELLVSEADEALYRAKREGRNRVVLSESGDSSTRGSLHVRRT